MDIFVCVSLYSHISKRKKRYSFDFFYPLTIFILSLFSFTFISPKTCYIRNFLVYVAMDIKIQPKFKITTTTAAISWGHFKFKRVNNWDWITLTVCYLDETPLCYPWLKFPVNVQNTALELQEGNIFADNNYMHLETGNY